MSNLEKAAWTEVAIVVLAMVAITIAIPFLGHRTMALFGLLGLLPVSMYFLRRRDTEVIVDERDREIEQRATFWGVHSAWMLLSIGLIVISIRFGSMQQDVPALYLNWLIWIQFAVCYLVKGLTAVWIYRGQRRAA